MEVLIVPLSLREMGMAKVPELLRSYLAILISNLFNSHQQLDLLALQFLLDPHQGLTIRERSNRYAYEISDEDFHKLATYVLNKEILSPVLYPASNELKNSFVRALKMHGYNVKEIETCEGTKWEVEPSFSPERIEKTKEEVKTLLEQLGLDEVQEGLNLAEELYIKGEFAKSLWNARKALEDLFQLISTRMGIDNKEFLSRFVKSDSAIEVIKKIDWYACKGHAVEISEHEAIFGYHLVLSTIYYLVSLFKYT
jgi:hypothetical protein